MVPDEEVEGIGEVDARLGVGVELVEDAHHHIVHQLGRGGLLLHPLLLRRRLDALAGPALLRRGTGEGQGQRFVCVVLLFGKGRWGTLLDRVRSRVPLMSPAWERVSVRLRVCGGRARSMVCRKSR